MRLPSPPSPDHRSLPAALSCLLLVGSLLLAGCAAEPRHGRRAEGRDARGPNTAAQQARAEAFAAGGYQPATSAPLAVALQQWVLGGDSVPLSLAYPSSGRELPLIIYLPGLGESSQAGAQWRQAWARAGYAVLCLQPLAEDAQAWSSELARAADFKGLGLHHYDSARLPARMRMVEAALAEARRRAATGDSLWSRVDFERLAVAGYGLGAQTALALAGQFPVKAIVTLSPLTALTALTAMPPTVAPQPALLSIGSARDSDPLGLFKPAEAARQLFEQAPAGGGRGLLWLHNASHASLAGSGLGEYLAEAARGETRGRAAESGGGRSRGGMGGGGMGGGKGRGGGGGGPGEGGPRGAQDTPVAQGHGNAEASAAISATSLAFLDARLRQRPAAQVWLDQAAEAWLAALGEWRQR